MADRRNPDHPLCRMVLQSTMWTRGQFARANDLTPHMVDELIRGYWKKNLIDIRDIATRLLWVHETPIYTHPPGAGIDPDLPKTLSATFAARYREAEVQPVQIYTATRKALQIFGMPQARTGLVTHATHDLLMTEVGILNQHRGRILLDPEPPRGRGLYEKQPDLGIYASNPTVPDVFVEVCGNYRQNRIEELLRFASASGITLELW